MSKTGEYRYSMSVSVEMSKSHYHEEAKKDYGTGYSDNKGGSHKMGGVFTIRYDDPQEAIEALRNQKNLIMIKEAMREIVVNNVTMALELNTPNVEKEGSEGKGLATPQPPEEGTDAVPPTSDPPPKKDEVYSEKAKALKEADILQKELNAKYGDKAPVVIVSLSNEISIQCPFDDIEDVAHGGDPRPCRGDLWDNREKIKSGEYKKNAPHFKCQENDEHKIWPQKPKKGGKK